MQTPPANIDIALIIINFRTPKITLDCLRTLAASRAASASPSFHVVLVENASNDNSLDLLRSEINSHHDWPSWITLLPSDSNRGFAGGNNFGLQWTHANLPNTPYILLLNSDTLVQPDTLPACFATMQNDPSIAMMSCKLLNTDGSIQNVTRRFPSPIQQTLCSLGLPWKFPRLFGWANVYDVPNDLLTKKRDCEWIGGAFMFIRRTALDTVGPLDESFFFYGEDIEFCHRFHKARLRIHYDPASAITHLGGSSSDPTRMASAARNRRMWQSRYLVQKKCYGTLAAAWIRSLDVLVFASKKIKLFCLGRRKTTGYQQVSEALSILIRKLDPGA